VHLLVCYEDSDKVYSVYNVYWQRSLQFTWQLFVQEKYDRPLFVTSNKGSAMAQAVSRRPPTSEARVSPCGICGEQSDNGTGFSPSTSVFPCQFHSTGAPLLEKIKKNN
jgi:hypothetical protein